jgi:hypothetical protein
MAIYIGRRKFLIKPTALVAAGGVAANEVAERLALGLIDTLAISFKFGLNRCYIPAQR